MSIKQQVRGETPKGMKSPLEMQVSSFVDSFFPLLGYREVKDDSKKSKSRAEIQKEKKEKQKCEKQERDAYNVINHILGVRISPDSVEEPAKLKSVLLSAIDKKYSEPDKIGNFLQEVRQSGELDGDNPLKTFRVNLKSFSSASDDQLIKMVEEGAVTEDMISQLPQNHIVRQRLMMVQKMLKKQMSASLGVREFKGNFIAAMRWSSLFEWGISKVQAMKQAMGISDRIKDAQVVMAIRAAGEQLLMAMQQVRPAPQPQRQTAPGIGQRADGRTPEATIKKV